ncbi:hypothetical protein LINGRAHAP2_LOCUS32038 [Linum grandiflorum]
MSLSVGGHIHGRRGEEYCSDPQPQTAVQLKEKKKIKEAKSLAFRLVDVGCSSPHGILAVALVCSVAESKATFQTKVKWFHPDVIRGAEKGSDVVPKVSEAELRRRKEKEQEQAEMAKKSEEVKKQARTTEEQEYERMVLVGNKNRDNSILEARTAEEAVVNLSFVEQSSLPVDRHPEKRLKSSFKEIQRLVMTLQGTADKEEDKVRVVEELERRFSVGFDG